MTGGPINSLIHAFRCGLMRLTKVGDLGFGNQFHLEVTPEMAREWAQVPEYRAYLAEALDRERADAFLAELQQRAEELHPTARRLFGNWLKLAGDAS